MKLTKEHFAGVCAVLFGVCAALALLALLQMRKSERHCGPYEVVRAEHSDIVCDFRSERILILREGAKPDMVFAWTPPPVTPTRAESEGGN
jgi:hypothetical protein